MHNSNPVRALLLAATWLIVVALPTPAQCLHWSKGFGLDSVDGSVHELFVHDDGTGPALFVGGEFSTAGDVLAAAIARWDGRPGAGSAPA